MPPTYRLFGTFRFALAMLVLLQHGLLVLPAAGQAPFYHLELGAIAVAVFFALSGFIVAEAIGQFYQHRPASFLANRALRLVPPYLVALALALGVDCLLYRAGELILLRDGLRGPPWQPRVILAGLLEIVPGMTPARISGQDFSIIPFAWSLRVEFTFYLAAAASCWWGVRARPWVLTAMCLAATIYVVLHGMGHPSELVNLPFFGFGIAAFLAGRQRARGALLAIGVACLVAYPFCGQRGQPVIALQLPLLALLLAALVALAGVRTPDSARTRWDHRLGALSYPLYIGHSVILTLVGSLWPARGAGPYALAVAGSILLAMMLHRVVETPMRGVRDRVRGMRL